MSVVNNSSSEIKVQLELYIIFAVLAEVGTGGVSRRVKDVTKETRDLLILLNHVLRSYEYIRRIYWANVHWSIIFAWADLLHPLRVGS